MSHDAVNLFVYGSLKNPATFRAVTGWSFHPAGATPPAREGPTLAAAPARLLDFELVSPDDLYFYAVERPERTIDGFVLFDVPAAAAGELADYEGPHYQLRTATAKTADGDVPVSVFAAPANRLRATLPVYSPGDRRRRLKAEVAFRARIDHFFAGGDGSTGGELKAQPVKVRAAREIKGATIRDLVRAHYHAPGLSEFFIRQALAGRPPGFGAIRSDNEASLFAESYLGLLVRLVIFNQFERRVFEQYRYEIDRIRGSDRFFEPAVSSLAALRMLRGLGPALTAVAGDAMTELDFHRNDFFEFVEWSILAADHLFDPAAARDAIGWIAANRTGGLIPLSADLELSNLPHGIGEGGFDPAYDSFRFFRGFGLNVLAWKLGGHIRPRPAIVDQTGQRGVLVLSLGSIGRRTARGDSTADPVEPVTADPWLLSQLIGHALGLYEIQPHALALTLHLPHRLRPRSDRATLPEPAIRCLLALGGDAGPNATGQPGVTVRRVSQREIVSLVPTRGLDLMRLARPTPPPVRLAALAHGRLGEPTPPARMRCTLAGYRFCRLAPQTDYAPMIFALKGLQLHYRPADMLTSKQMQADPVTERMFSSLLEWSDCPAPISPAAATEFLDAVQAGLATERHGRPAHPREQIAAAISQLETGLREFNNKVGSR
ncbi:MAG: gamma-glutamylcyclotransferase [Phycisphaerae bacterium]|nr:gamma-glutamylcyclotransferase [Phycisphaerae bacterium]